MRTTLVVTAHLYESEARFVDDRTVEISGGDADGARLQAETSDHRPRGQILGCHIIGPEASNLIEEVVQPTCTGQFSRGDDHDHGHKHSH